MSVCENLGTAVRPEPILVTDGETRAALAIARSLGRAGHVVHVVSTSGRSLAGASRWCHSEHRAPNAVNEPLAWAESIESLACKLDANVLPTTELAIGSLFAAGSELRLDLIAPSRSHYEAAIDKFGLVERSRRIGIEVPDTLLVEEFGALETLPEPFGFPVVAKPRRSRLLWKGSWHSPPVSILRDLGAFQKAANAWQPAHGDTLIQEFVPGSGEGLFALCEKGEIQTQFSHRRLREKPPLGGVSVLRESIDVAPDVARASQRLLSNLGFSGIAMVEFRRAPEGRLALMEINPRPWGSMQLAIDAGVDFPKWMWEAHRGALIDPSMTQARSGVRTRWLLGDFDHWIACVRSQTLREELGLSLGQITRAFFWSFFDGSRLEVLRARDPMPFARELGEWFVALRGER